MQFKADSVERIAAPSLLRDPDSELRVGAKDAIVALAYLLFCVLVQHLSGAGPAGFLVTLDEPSHFVGSVMVRDWLASSHWLSPLAFARKYYDHYPFFAVGYWPPLFSVVTGVWMLLVGVGRTQALLIPAACAAGTAWLVYYIVRPRCGIVAAICAGIIYLELPDVRQGMCVVMVDHMTTFLTIAAAACLLLYLKQPILRNGILCGILYTLALLSKYSAAYLVALPFVVVVLTRRFELLRRPSLWVQPVIVGVLAGPWILWTRNMALVGLPGYEMPPSIIGRVLSFLQEAFAVFPPFLMAVVVLGLLALVSLPRAWKDEVVVFIAVFALHTAFMFVAPIGPEHRYLLTSACALLILASIGWSNRFEKLQRPQWSRAAVCVLTVVTAGVVLFNFTHLEREPADSLSPVLDSINRGNSQPALHIVVPPTAEGPFIAAFLGRSCCRLRDYLIRPSKVLGHADWFMEHVTSTFQSPDEMMSYFELHPVDFIVWQKYPAEPLNAYSSVMREMLETYPLKWRLLPPADGGESRPAWAVYHYEAGTKP